MCGGAPKVSSTPPPAQTAAAPTTVVAERKLAPSKAAEGKEQLDASNSRARQAAALSKTKRSGALGQGADNKKSKLGQ